MNAEFLEVFSKYEIEKRKTITKSSMLSLSKLKEKIIKFESKYGKVYLLDINLRWMQDFIKYLSNGKLGKCCNNTLKLYGTLLCSFLNRAKIEGYSINNDFERITLYLRELKIPRNTKTILSDEELALLWKYEGFYNKTGTYFKATKSQLLGIRLWIFQTQIGCRWGDLSRIQKKHILYKNGEYYIANFETQKSKSIIYVHLNSLAFNILFLLCPRFNSLSPSSFIFSKSPSASNATHNLKIISKRCNLNRIVVKSTGKLDKIKTKKYKLHQVISTHDARRRFATVWIQEGRDIYKLSKILGHRSVKTTEQYIVNNLDFIPDGIENKLSAETKQLFFA